MTGTDISSNWILATVFWSTALDLDHDPISKMIILTPTQMHTFKDREKPWTLFFVLELHTDFHDFYFISVPKNQR